MSLADVIAEIREREQPTPRRSYMRLCRAIAEGTEIGLSDHELVVAIGEAVWHHELATAYLGLTELETRTALHGSYLGRDLA